MSHFERFALVVQACRADWQLVPDGSFPLSYRYVEPVRTADGTAAVLKVGPPDDRGHQQELDAAEWFAGRGGPRILAIDRERGAMLLERALPGTRLRSLVPDREEEANAAAAELMRTLWRAPAEDHRFPTVRQWGRSLEPGTRAAGLFGELCDSMAEPVVLHGDLHHDNVLSSGAEGWLAIDPKGVIGEPAYEPGALLRNPKPGLLELPSPGRLLRRRADQLAEALELEPARVRGWAYAQAVLSAAWSVQDGEDPSFALAVAELLEPLTR